MKNIIVVIILLAGLGVGLMFLRKKSKDKEADESKDIVVEKVNIADDHKSDNKPSAIGAKVSADECLDVQVHIAKLSQADALAALSEAEKKAKLDEIRSTAEAENSKGIEECMATDKEVVKCMLAADAMDKIQACLPK